MRGIARDHGYNPSIPLMKGDSVARQRVLVRGSGAAMAHSGWLVVLAAALSTTLMLQSTRVFVSYLVWVVDQANRGTLALVALAVYAATALALLLPRFVGPRGALFVAVGALVVPRAVLQVVPQPELRLVLAAIAVAAWSWLLLQLLARQVDAVALGLGVGFAFDLALRLGRMTVDLPWMAGAGAHVLAFALVGALVLVIVLLAAEVPLDSATPYARFVPSPLSVLAIGPALVIYHLMSGNPGLAQVKLDATYPTASWWMVAGTGIGLLLALVVLRAPDDAADLPDSAATGRPVLSAPVVLLITLLIGAGLFLLFWTQPGLRHLAWVLGIAGVLPLLALAMSGGATAVAATDADEGVRGWRAWLRTPSAMVWLLTGSLVVHVALIFIYYSSTGNLRWIVVAWALLVVSALFVGGPDAGAQGTGVRLAVAPRLVPLQGMVLVGVAGVALLIGGVVAQAQWKQPRTTGPLGSEIVVFDWNIQSGFARDNSFALDRQADEIRRIGPGVVLLQEVQRGWLMSGGMDQALWLSQELGLQFAFGAGSGDGLWGNAILTNAPMSSVRVQHLGDSQNLRRAALQASIEADVPGGAVWFHVTHLDDPKGAGEVRLEQVQELLNVWGGRVPAVIAGDFNATPDDALMAKLQESGFYDRSVDVTPNFTTSNDERRIDYIFVSPQLRFRRLLELNTWASDHRPVVQHIDVRP